MTEPDTFWERVQYAIAKAAEDARQLPIPFEQELIIWQETGQCTRHDKLYYFITLKAAWIRQTGSTFLMDERNF